MRKTITAIRVTGPRKLIVELNVVKRSSKAYYDFGRCPELASRPYDLDRASRTVKRVGGRRATRIKLNRYTISWPLPRQLACKLLQRKRYFGGWRSHQSRYTGQTLYAHVFFILIQRLVVYSCSSTFEIYHFLL